MANDALELELVLEDSETLELKLDENDLLDIDLEKSLIIINPIVERNYEKLDNKPSINGVELSGDKPLEDFGIDINNDYRALNYLPSINGILLYGDKTTEELGINDVLHSEITNVELEELLNESP